MRGCRLPSCHQIFSSFSFLHKKYILITKGDSPRIPFCQSIKLKVYTLWVTCEVSTSVPDVFLQSGDLWTKKLNLPPPHINTHWGLGQKNSNEHSCNEKLQELGSKHWFIDMLKSHGADICKDYLHWRWGYSLVKHWFYSLEETLKALALCSPWFCFLKGSSSPTIFIRMHSRHWRIHPLWGWVAFSDHFLNTESFRAQVLG